MKFHHLNLIRDPYFEKSLPFSRVKFEVQLFFSSWKQYNIDTWVTIPGVCSKNLKDIFIASGVFDSNLTPKTKKWIARLMMTLTLSL